MRRALLVVSLIGLAAAPEGGAQSADDDNEGTRIEWDAVNEIYRFRWWGREGRTYFIQHTEDLGGPWNWVPAVESGADAIKEYGFTTTGDKMFLRLKLTDIATSDPEGDDFDGDGLSNLWEVQNGLNPLSADSDGDGMPDDWEVANGLDGSFAGDAQEDPDDDGLANLGEYLGGSDPNNADSDGDGLRDGWSRAEILYNASGWMEAGLGESVVHDGAGNVESGGGL
jgi:hypothetical protein